MSRKKATKQQSLPDLSGFQFDPPYSDGSREEHYEPPPLELADRGAPTGAYAEALGEFAAAADFASAAVAPSRSRSGKKAPIEAEVPESWRLDLPPKPPPFVDPRQALQSVWGFEEFRPGQREVVDAVLGGEDVIGVLPTGQGKTMIFQLPAVMRRDRPVLVISPLIALMRSQVQRALKEGIPAAALTSQYTPRQQREVIDQIPNLSLLYVAPERFEDSRFLDAIRRTPPWLVAIDESHSVSDWGLSFRPAYRFARDMLVQSGLDEGLQWLALTASATEEVVADLRQQYGMQDAKLYRFSCDRPNLDYVVERCVRGMKMVKIQRLVESSLSDGGCAIVYTQSRREAEELAEWFRKSNPRRPCKHYHAGIGKPQRAEVERLFFDKEIDVVFSTCAFGMGIDRSDVRLVVMHGMPKSIEDFYQMAGRAGRDGERCKAVALYAGDDDYKKREWLIKNGHDLENNRFKENYGMHDPKFAQAIDQQLRLLKQLDWFMRSRECRAVLLRRYFGEKDGVACGRCDACKFSMGGRP